MKKPFKSLTTTPAEPLQERNAFTGKDRVETHWLDYELTFKRHVFIRADEYNNWISFGPSEGDQNPTDENNRAHHFLSGIIKELYPEEVK
jgi:hypothetical protein